MAERTTKRTFRVDGMSCGSCEGCIERAVAGLAGVAGAKASASLGEVEVRFDPSAIDAPAIAAAIQGAGYSVHEASERSRPRGVLPFLGLLAVALGAWLALRFTGGVGFLPVVSQSMGYGLVFLVGLLTSLHCIGMCGGIALSQGVSRSSLATSLLYNAGRVASYTALGGIVGGVGSVISFSPVVKGILPVVAGAFMALFGIRMLGIFPWLSRLRIRIPGLAGSRLSSAAARRGPFVVGLLNGLMPCGPLQTMQVYAMGTGSALAGALSMLLFSLGTVPLMLGLGTLSALLSSRFTRRLAAASGGIVAVLGLVMMGRGLALSGVAVPGVSAPFRSLSGAGLDAGQVAVSGVALARLTGGIQEVTTRMASGRYQPLVVQQGVPVRWTITANEDDLNGCNNPVTVPRYGISRELVPGRNVIEFTPDRAGTIVYTCWMGMISSTITVVGDLASYTPDPRQPADPGDGLSASVLGSAFSGSTARGGCCVAP
jgi:sulfite exporter TauE/SafE/copper chaperone CopZ